MQRIRFNELSDAVQAFLRRVLDGGGVVLEDENGRTRGGVIPYRDPSPVEERRADVALQQLWKTTEKAMSEQGITEADIDRVLLEDD